jgi:replication factor C small subunit
MNFIEEEKDVKSENSIWAEKYRPKKLNEYIGSEVVKETIKCFIEKNDIPHLLFFGIQGCGKTSLAKLIVKNIDCDYIYVNSSDESGIDTVRTKIKDFAASVGFKKLKVVILDEFDRNRTLDSQCALRNIMETYSLNTRFILTANFSENIIAPIISRCQTFEIKPLSKKEIAQHVVKILENEGVKFDIEHVAFIINTYYPDIRKIINFCQQSSLNKVLKIAKENAIETDTKNKLIALLTQRKPNTFDEIRQLIANSDIDAFEPLYKHLFEKVSEYAKGNESIVIIEIAESIYKSSLVFEKEISFLACIIRILDVLNKK